MREGSAGRTGNAGITMMEVLVAMTVFSVAFLHLGRMQLVAKYQGSDAGRLTRATALAQDRIEQLQALPFNSPLLVDNTVVGQTTAYTEPNPPVGYMITWTVDNGTPTANVMTVNLRITWQNRGRMKTFELPFYKQQS